MAPPHARWEAWNLGVEPTPYGMSPTYAMGAAWLEPCALVEDWGCGRGYLTTLIPPHRYRGVDGSRSRFAEVVADLATYRSDVPGVFIRHVLEHSYAWQAILDNAIASARERLFLAIFTPIVRKTRELAYADFPGAPDIAFALPDLVKPIAAAGFDVQVDRLKTDTQYGVETAISAVRA